MVPVVAELPRYGVDPAEGYVAWLHETVVIDLSGFGQTDYANNYPQITAADFVLAADITWNTRNSISGCGFMFRSNGDPDRPDQYMALMDGEVSNFREYYPKDEDKSFDWFNDSTDRLTVVVRGELIDLYTNGTLIGQVDITQAPPDAVLQTPEIVIPDGVLPGQLQQFQDVAIQQDQGNNQVRAQLSDARRNFAINKPFLYDGLLGFLGVSDARRMICTFQNAWLFIMNR